jgi:protein gp37
VIQLSRTLINWADQVWNWLLGCERVSDGCNACYAILDAWIRSSNPNEKIAAANSGLAIRDGATGLLDWTGVVRFLPERLGAPLKQAKGERWFVNSKSDLFHADVRPEWIAQGLAVMAACPRHTFLTLTKRHARMRALLTSPGFRALYEAAYAELTAGLPARQRHEPIAAQAPWPIPNLHLGVSAESPEWAAIRLPDLLRCRPAAGVLWVSVEPQLARIDLRNLPARDGTVIDALRGEVKDPADGTVLAACPGALDWVVAGGESGPLKDGKSRPAARPAELEWFRALRDQCDDTPAAFWFKQTGTVAARKLGIRGSGDQWEDLPGDLAIRELPRTFTPPADRVTRPVA